MSNQIVGPTYAQIIDKVIQASQTDFEEFGVDQQTLHELKETWQQKTSALHVAIFPWDPAPPAPVNPPTVPSNVPKPEVSPAPPSAPLSQPQPNYGNPRIKAESGYDSPAMKPAHPGLDRNLAQQRAAALLQQNYGQQADASIASAGITQYNGLTLPGQPRPTGLQLPNQAQQPRPPQQQVPQPPQQRRSNLYNAQTDGAGDDGEDAAEQWRALIRARREFPQDGAEGTIAVDGMLRARLEELSRRLDSGLMVPLSDVKPSKGRKMKMVVRSAGPSTGGPIPQFDGEFDDDEKGDVKEEDDEAINSDLDDSEDELAQAENDENETQKDTMLCTYDKVQRVKNKWKCTLKDGILSTNNKDYLFHKANGEFEW